MAKEKEKEEKKGMNLALPVLLLLLVAGSFLAGTMWSKIKTAGEKAGEEEKNKRQVQFEVKEEGEQVSPTRVEEGVLGEEEIGQLEVGAAAVKGNEGAPVTIVEFSEYLCPFCAEYVGIDVIPNQPIDQGKTYQKIMDQYVATSKVRYVFQDFAVHGQPAMERGVAARCAGQQGQYWEYHDLLFEKIKEEVTPDALREKLATWAVGLGLDKEEFSVCLESEEQLQAVKNSYDLGRKVGVSGTPTFFINGQKLRGAQPFESFEAVIEAELAK